MASRTPSKELAALDRIARTLAESWDLAELVSIRDLTEAVRLHGKSARRGLELQNRAAELRLRAERKVGGILAELRLHGGDRKSASQDPVVRLEDLGITKDQSSRWQRLARVPEKDFEAYITEAKRAGEEITWSQAIRWRAKATASGDTRQ